MRVVLDTNVLLSALISRGGVPDRIYRAWRAGKFILISSRVQIAELRRASRYPKLRTVLQPHLVGKMINNLQRTIVLEHLVPSVETDDPNDAFLLAMAGMGQADYLVTGDKHAGLLQRGSFGRTQIVTPGVFCLKMA